MTNVVASPDQEVFYEQLSILNDDLVGIRVKPAPNVFASRHSGRPSLSPTGIYPSRSCEPSQ